MVFFEVTTCRLEKELQRGKKRFKYDHCRVKKIYCHFFIHLRREIVVKNEYKWAGEPSLGVGCKERRFVS
jgi:hypothetical protein